MASIKTRARAVDMLGRQQIAGVQNALGEIFKNAYDAYATCARVDFFDSPPGADNSAFLMIRDNGIGMTRFDFEEKWLVLGTESKVGDGRPVQFRPPSLAERPVTGEKGIGRLAIALLGRQVLVLSRALRSDGLHDLVAGFLHWGLFEIPGINLDEIDVPVATFPGGSLPTAEDISTLTNDLLVSIEAIERRHSVDIKSIRSDIARFKPDPVALHEFLSAREDEPLLLTGESSGTCFVIAPTNPVIGLEMDIELTESDYSFRRQILGFFDSTFGEAIDTPMRTSFNRWQPGANIGEDLLHPAFFFSREDLDNRSDHLLRGRVDEYGQFVGSLRVYKQCYDNLVIPWPDSRGQRTRCGPFAVSFAYLMGLAKESIVLPDEFEPLNNKLHNLGGIYVYRDRVRILPYGDFAYDWLEVEKRRNKGAGYYFFSFRRMFGAVLLTRKENGELQEKAGREGFQQNEAYRQLRQILMHLLVQLAADFFRSGGAYTEVFEAAQSDNRRRADALARQQKRASSKRRQFKEQLERFGNEQTRRLLNDKVAAIQADARSRIGTISAIAAPDEAAGAALRAERDLLAKVQSVREEYSFRRPTGIGLTKELAREWERYLAERSELEASTFGPLEHEIAERISGLSQERNLPIDQRRRLEELLEAFSTERKNLLGKAAATLASNADDVQAAVSKVVSDARTVLDIAIRRILAELNRCDLSVVTSEEAETMRIRWQNEISAVETRHREILSAAGEVLASFASNLSASSAFEPAAVLEALEERLIALEDQAEEDFEMVQLGLAIAIINHEFASSIRRIRRAIQELGLFARRSAGLRSLYDSIRTNFEQLDGYLNLFTPLQRRLYRTTQKVSGNSIYNYVTDLFANRLERHKITLDCSEGFRNVVVECFPSTLYPAIVNLLDNAIFWLGSVRDARRILLHADENGIVVANNGPRVERMDWDRIFERGFSRKPGGRGLGLYISGRALASEGMRIGLEDPPQGCSVAFRITVPAARYSSK